MKNIKLYGLIGYPLSHSFSKKYFSTKFEKENINNCEYHNFEIENINQLKELIELHENLQGLNVTIPYKESVMGLLDDLDDIANSIGAVNTIKIIRDKYNNVKLIGYNTDFYGFYSSLKDLMTGNERYALVFGSGGSSKAVQYALKQLNLSCKVVSRTNPHNGASVLGYDDISPLMMSQTDIIVNTTPLGMYPNTNATVDIPYEYIKKGCIAYDLIYNPSKTLFLQKAEKNGAVICNGLRMLELQAEKSWNIFHTLTNT